MTQNRYEIKLNYDNHRQILKEEFDKIMVDLLSAGAIPKDTWKILEVGAGKWNAKKWFEEAAPEIHVDGIKVGETIVEYTGIDNGSEYFEEPGTIMMDAHDMKAFANDTFDIVFMSHTAEHFHCPTRAFQEIQRVLKPGGVVLSITPYPCEHQILFGDASHFSVLSPIQWVRVLMGAFFKYENIKSYVQMTYQGVMIPKEQDYMVITVGRKNEQKQN